MIINSKHVDSGADPVINPLSVTANGTYTAPSGVDGYSPVTVNVPQGITPTGNINITDTNVTDVTNYATAQVVDADLVAGNIKEGVNILGILGTFAGGGGGSLPSVISKIDGGSFTPTADTQCRLQSISHSLGVIPKGVTIWTDDNAEAQTYAYQTLITATMNALDYSYSTTTTSKIASHNIYRNTNGNCTTAAASSTTTYGEFLTANSFKFNFNQYYKASATYKWIAWA